MDENSKADLETNNNGGTPADTDAGGIPAESAGTEPKYSDADVEKIVQKRLARERAKNEKQQEQQTRLSELEQREKNIEIKERKLSARETFKEMGFQKIPETALKLLRYDTEEEYEQSLTDVSQLITELVEGLEVKAATGRTPKAYKQNKDPAGDIRKAFGL